MSVRLRRYEMVSRCQGGVWDHFVWDRKEGRDLYDGYGMTAEEAECKAETLRQLCGNEEVVVPDVYSRADLGGGHVSALRARDMAHRCESLQVALERDGVAWVATASVDDGCARCGAGGDIHYAREQARTPSSEHVAEAVASVVRRVMLVERL